MPDPYELDAILDGLALIEAVHRGDLDGGRCVLDNGNPRLIAAFLARVAADLVEDLAEDPAELFAWLREHHS
jgi:hypothetical protein